MLIVREDDNLSDNFRSHKDQKPALKELDIEKNNIDLVSKSLDTESLAKDMLSDRVSQDRLLKSELSPALKEVRFNDLKFAVSILISNIKYNHPGF